MTESNKSTRSGLGGKPRPPITEEKPKEPEKEPKPRGSSPRPPKSIAPVIILVVAGFTVLGGIGWLLWSNEQKNSQQRTEIDQKYSKIKESIPQIDKDIANAKSLGDLKNLDVRLSQSGKDLDALKNQAEQIAYSNGLDSIKAEIETSKTSSNKLNNRIAIENNANAIIKDAKNSVSSFLNVDSLNCDALKSSDPKFSEAIGKLKTVPAQTFAQVEVKKLSNDYTGLKNRAIDQYKAICTTQTNNQTNNTVETDISSYQPNDGGSSNNSGGSPNNPTGGIPPNTSKPPIEKPLEGGTQPSEVCRVEGSTVICP